MESDVRTSRGVCITWIFYFQDYLGKIVQQCRFVGRFPPLQSWVAWAEREEEEEEEEGQEDIKVTFTFLQQFRLGRRQRTRNDRGETAKDKGGREKTVALSFGRWETAVGIVFPSFDVPRAIYQRVIGHPPPLPRGSKVQG